VEKVESECSGLLFSLNLQNFNQLILGKGPYTREYTEITFQGQLPAFERDCVKFTALRK